MKNIKKFVKRKGHHIAAVLVVVLILVTAGVCVSIPVIKVTNKRKASKDVLVSNTIQVADSTYGIPGNSADADNSYVELADGDPQSDNMSQELSENGIELNITTFSNDNMAYSNGIDVSKWQGKIDWNKVAESGIDYAMIRVGYRTDIYGTICEDEYASYNLEGAQKAGIDIGVYFFSTAVDEDEAIEEACWVIDYISAYDITYPVVYNCEDYNNPSSRMYNLSNEERTNNALAFMDTVDREGYDAMLYAGKGQIVNNKEWNIQDIEARYPIWGASYKEGTYPAVEHPSYTGACAMWQYTNNARIDGISGYVDVNVAYFNYNSSFNYNYGTQASVSGQTQQSLNTAELGIIFNSVNEEVTAKEPVNLRSIPEVSGDIVDVLDNGDIALRTGIGDTGWSRLIYNGNVVYAVTSYLTTDY